MIQSTKVAALLGEGGYFFILFTSFARAFTSSVTAVTRIIAKVMYITSTLSPPLAVDFS